LTQINDSDPHIGHEILSSGERLYAKGM